MQWRVITVVALILSSVAVGAWLRSQDAPQDDAEVSTRSHAEALVRWGNAWAEAGDLDQAITGYTEALQVDSEFPDAYTSRGRAWERKGEWEKAVADYSEAIRRLPDNTNLHIMRRYVWGKTGRWDKVIEDYTEIVARHPNDPRAWNELAWVLATCPDDRFRNGDEAVQDAKRACALANDNDPNYVDTLAAAFAELGDFDRAVEFQKKALADRRFDKRFGDDARARLVLYEHQKPYREGPQPLVREKRKIAVGGGSIEVK